MKSWKNLISLVGTLPRFCILVFLLFAYTINLAPEGVGSSKLHCADKTVVFDESDADLSSDFEIDLIDDLLVKPVYPQLFHGFFSNVTEERAVKSQTDFTVHLEILTPPPRLNS